MKTEWFKRKIGLGGIVSACVIWLAGSADGAEAASFTQLLKVNEYLSHEEDEESGLELLGAVRRRCGGGRGARRDAAWAVLAGNGRGQHSLGFRPVLPTVGRVVLTELQ